MNNLVFPSLKVDENIKAEPRLRSSHDNPYSYLICQLGKDGISSQLPVKEFSLWKIYNEKSIKKHRSRRHIKLLMKPPCNIQG